MTELFYLVLNMSISASILVLVVLALRLLLRKAPKWVNVLLWGLVAIRLICPFTVESPLSLMPETNWLIQDRSLSEDDLIYGTVPDSIPDDAMIDSSLDENITVTYYPADPQVEIHRGVSLTFVLNCIWLIGIAVMLTYMVVSYICVFRRVRYAKQFRDNIYTSENVPSPFVFGIIKPRIYLPENTDAVSMSYVIAHEEAHIRRCDHLWKPIGFLLLAVHWFNPLIWLGYILLCRDIEMACDERVVKDMEDAERADYSEALLTCSVNRKMISACPLAFGEVGVKDRIKSVLNYKKPAFWIVILAVIVCAMAAVCFLTNPEKIINASLTGLRFPCEDPISAESCIIEINGKVENNEFKGTFTVDGRRMETSIDMTSSTPTMRYYEGSKLNSYGLFYILNDAFSKFAFTLNESDEYVICGMTIKEFEAEMRDRNYYVEYLHGTDVSETDSIRDQHLTLDDVITLSSKGYDLTWKDFDGYNYIETGSGLYIRVYEIDENFELWIGGSSPINEPMYIYLALADDIDTKIDIRDGGVELFVKFIAQINSESEENFPNPVIAYAYDIISSSANTMFGTSWAFGIREMEKMNTGTAGLSEEILLVRLDFWVTPNINGWDGTDSSQAVFTEIYFAIFRDWSTGEDIWTRLGFLTGEEIESLYNTDAMINKYGNMYTAAACELAKRIALLR